MQCTVHIYVLNEHFSQEYADLHNEGKDSEMNKKYDWEDELFINSDVKTIESNRDEVYLLRGSYDTGETFEFPIEGMLIFDLLNEDGTFTQIAASESMVDHFEVGQQDGQWKIEIFIKDYEPMANPVPGIYIASKAFPSALIRE